MRQQQRETKSFFSGSDEGGGGGGGGISSSGSSSVGGAVLLTLEDDYLAPSQACVNPAFTTKAVPPENDSSAAAPDQEENKNDSGGSNSNNNNNKKKEQEGAVTVRPRARRRRRREQKQPRAISSEVSNDPAAAAAVDATNADPSAQSHSQSQSEQRDEKPRSARQRPARDAVGGSAKKGNDSDLVQASVADCLACSGCITTAESVLLQDRHSLDKLRQAVGSFPFPRAGGSGNAVAKNRVVVTISPASAADLFRAVGLSLPPDRAQRAEEHRNALRRLSSLLNRALNGAVEAVLDGEAAQEWSLRAAAEEFCRAYRYFREQSQRQRGECGDVAANEMGRNGTRGPAASEAERLERDLCPSQAIDSTKSVYLVRAGGRDGRAGGNKEPSQQQIVVNHSSESRGRTQQALPILSGSCPAAVCLVEKSRWSAVPHLQTTKSPMALAGAFWRTKRRMTPPSPRSTSHFHLAIMPCHDKKLEASRKDFVPAETGRSDVDLVITTQECLDLLLEAEDKKTKEQGRSDMRCREESVAALKRYLSGDDEGSENHDNNSEDVSPTMADVQYVTKDMLCSSCTVEPSEKATRRPILITTAPSFDPPPQKECCKGNRITTSTANGCTGKNTGSGSCGGCESALGDNREGSEFYPFSGGGSADYIFRYAARELFGYQVRGPVPWKPYQVAEAAAAASGSAGRVVAPQQSARLARAAKRKRNVNYYHAALYRLPDGGGYALREPAAVEGLPTGGGETGAQQPVLHFGIAHGMQTLQRVLQPFGDDRDEPKEGGVASKRQVDGAAPAAGKSPFHYVEAMACPSGACLNGGGQVRTGTAEKPRGGRERPAETQKRVRQTQAYHAAASSEHRLVTDKGPTSSRQRGILPPTEYHTTYHVVPPLQLSRGAVEGVAVEDVQW